MLNQNELNAQLAILREVHELLFAFTNALEVKKRIQYHVEYLDVREDKEYLTKLKKTLNSQWKELLENISLD
jgi:hypothetical protein